jgi:cyclophilin family peptidyl-prolyl cis-trans isomerase
LARIEEKKLEQLRTVKKKRLQKIGVPVALVVIVLGGIYGLTGSPSPTTSTSTTIAASTSTVATSTTTVAPAVYKSIQARATALAVRAGCPASTKTRVNTLSWKTSPAVTIDLTKTYYAHFITTAGAFVVRLDSTQAPVTVNNFIFLAQHNFYHCVLLHRVIPGFMIQGGDPTGTGTGGPGYTIADEYPKTGSPTYPLYSIAMANEGRPDTGGSQFFIVTGAEGEALSAQYSLFGQVVSGFTSVLAISNEGTTADNGMKPNVTNRIISVTISTSK